MADIRLRKPGHLPIEEVDLIFEKSDSTRLTLQVRLQIAGVRVMRGVMVFNNGELERFLKDDIEVYKVDADG